MNSRTTSKFCMLAEALRLGFGQAGAARMFGIRGTPFRGKSYAGDQRPA